MLTPDGYLALSRPGSVIFGSTQEMGPKIWFSVLNRRLLLDNPEAIELTCTAPTVAADAQAGQFLVVRREQGTIPIVFPISAVDRELGYVSFVGQPCSAESKAICMSTPGTIFADILGPTGKPTHLLTTQGTGLIVSGDHGLTFAYSLLRMLGPKESNYIPVILPRSPLNRAWIPLFKKLCSNPLIGSEDSEKAFRSEADVVQDVIENSLRRKSGVPPITVVYTVGTVPLMQSVASVTNQYRISTFASLGLSIAEGAVLSTAHVYVSSIESTLPSIYEALHFSEGTPNDDEIMSFRAKSDAPHPQYTPIMHGIMSAGLEFNAHTIDWNSITTPISSYTQESDRPMTKHPPPKEKPAATQVEMPMQPVGYRCKNWKQVELGYTPEQAIREAHRCLQCRKPMCVKGCPVHVPIPEFIGRIRESDFLGAYRLIKDVHSCPSVTGRICPQENQCQAAEGASGCILCRLGKEPVAIGRLERFVADYVRENHLEDEAIKEKDGLPLEITLTGYKVAVIGSGPSGLAAAKECSSVGHRVTIFEACHVAGGVLAYGIPKFRLPKSIIEHEIMLLTRRGPVEIRYNTMVGRDTTISELQEQGYAAIYIGIGVGKGKFLGIPGENLPGVILAEQFLSDCNLTNIYDRAAGFDPVARGIHRVVIIGAGNVAMDCARCVCRMGVKACIMYRRRLQDSPALVGEIAHAREEGTEFLTLCTPVEIVGNETCTGIKGVRGQVNEVENSEIIPVPGEFKFVACQLVILAIGQSADRTLSDSSKQLAVNKYGLIVTDDDFATSLPGVFAGGDIRTGAATAIKALGAGKRAGQEINKWIVANAAGLSCDESLRGQVYRVPPMQHFEPDNFETRVKAMLMEGIVPTESKKDQDVTSNPKNPFGLSDQVMDAHKQAASRQATNDIEDL
ncbi:Glutamate synthase [Giardia muris]|uniref:Glutamate synthase n=1 Tax=Giardia muris TaxID=5742 RepID=A0A4Z1TA71_GIAMU|nr:Glutamate synthase [Giardia muris]|eukprot:TNJ29431.1 Glutamate synthase [Giardia muris]